MKKKTQLSNYGKYSSLAFQMLVIILAGVFGGLELDKAINTSPVFTIILSIAAVALSIYFAIKDLLKFNK